MSLDTQHPTLPSWSSQRTCLTIQIVKFYLNLKENDLPIPTKSIQPQKEICPRILKRNRLRQRKCDGGARKRNPDGHRIVPDLLDLATLQIRHITSWNRHRDWDRARVIRASDPESGDLGGNAARCAI